MPAQRDASGKSIKGSGAPGWKPEDAKAPDAAAASANKARGAWGKAFGAAKSLAVGGMGALSGGAKALTPAFKALGGVVKTLATGDVPNAQQAMTALGSAVGGAATAGAAKLSTALAGLGPEGAAAGAAIEILTGAFAALFGSMTTIMGLAIEVTQKIDLMRDRFAALAGSAAGGKAVQAMLSHLNLPFASSEVNTWAQSLLGAGIKGKQLESDLRAVAAATALMGESGGAAAMTLFKRLGDGGPAAETLLKTFQKGGPKADKLLKEMGLSIADIGGTAALSKMNATQLHEALANAMQKKGAGPLADMALTLPVILTKAQEGFRSIFAKLGPAVKPFMKAVKELFGHFNKGTPIMKTLQKIVTTVFGAIFKYATMAVKAISGMFKGGGASKLMLSIWNALKSVFKVVAFLLSPIGAMFKAIYKNAFLMNGIKTVFKVIGAIILVVVGIIGVFIVAFVAIVAIVGAVVGTVVGLVGQLLGAIGGLAASAAEAGSNFIGGLLGAISGGAGSIIASVKGLASSALGAFTGLLGIHSDSAVMKKMGGHFVGGAVAGVESETPKVSAAASKMGDAASSSAGASMKSGGGAKGGKSITVTFESGSIVIHAGSAHVDEAQLAIVIERALLSQGL